MFCVRARGGETLVAVLVEEDGEQDALRKNAALGTSLDGVDGVHGLALFKTGLAEAGEQVIEIGP